MPDASRPKGHATTGVSVRAYRGDEAVLLAFDLDPALTTDLAGFAIKRTAPNGASEYLFNRLNFDDKVTSETAPSQRTWTPSDQAPIQKFRWMDFPSQILSGSYTYEASAVHFKAAGGLALGPTASTALELATQPGDHFRVGFTRGYLSSQAYATEFGNAAFRPASKSIDFDTTPYEKQYEWLGYHARQMLMQFLEECVADEAITVDVFAYDLDEPDVIRQFAKLGDRLRLLLDNASLHVGPTAMEPLAQALLENSAGLANVKTGHFQRFSHSKVLIQKRDGKSVKVLTGSTNFSIRGLYVQANNMILIQDPAVAQQYQQSFDEAFTDMAHFSGAPIAAQWFDFNDPGLPALSVAFSPHKTASVSLDKVAAAIKAAKSSVFFSVMELGGGGDVLQDLQALAGNPQLFSYGITQTTGGLKVYKPGSSSGSLADFNYLDSKVPEPFTQEWRGGVGQVIHHKFVVVDFSGPDPCVFAGSSNLASGGETSNGDNLLAISDESIATMYAVEAVRLFDHYHFRDAMQTATDAKPLVLQGRDATPKWWEPYYDLTSIKYRDRLLFAGT